MLIVQKRTVFSGTYGYEQSIKDVKIAKSSRMNLVYDNKHASFTGHYRSWQLGI